MIEMFEEVVRRMVEIKQEKEMRGNGEGERGDNLSFNPSFFSFSFPPLLSTLGLAS